MAEVLISLAILSLVLALGLMRHGSEVKRATSEGLCHLLISELRAARAEAITLGRPIAICWPSGSGPLSQSFYRIEGQSMGHPKGGRQLDGEYSNAYIAVGFWGDATIDPDPNGSGQFDVENWLPEDFSDFAIVFTPDGKVSSNDLPRVDGNYQVLVVAALEATSEAPPGSGAMTTQPPYFRLQRVAAAHSIVITPGGSISYHSGASGLPAEAHPFAMTMSASPLPLISPPKFTAPRVTQVSLQSPAKLDRVGTVVPSGTLNVEVKGSDSSGDDLFLEWSATKLSGAASDAGYFSESGRYPMKWNPRSGSWESVISWMPPQDGAVGDTFELQFTMSNSAGRVPSRGYSLLTDITIVDDALIFTSGTHGLYKVHKNGTGHEQVISDTSIGGMGGAVDVSPDGTKVAWIRQAPFSRYLLMVSDIQGGGTEVLVNSNETWMSPCWNETGTRIFYLESGRLMSMYADGSARAQVLPALPALQRHTLVLSPNGAYVATWGGADLWIGKLNQSTSPPTIDYWTNLSAAHSPDGRLGNQNVYIAFQKGAAIANRPVLVTRAAPRETNIWSVTDSGSGFTSTLAPLLYSGQPLRDHMQLAFSADGTQVVTVTGVANSTKNNLNLFDYDTSGGVPQVRNRRLITCDFEPYYIDWR